jgi:polysaccharide export outer membrane protein
MKFRNLLILVCMAIIVSSCDAPKLGYFQDVQSGQVQQLSAPKLVTVEPGDKLSILVGSKDPGLAYLFNLQIVGRYKTSQSDANLSTTQVASYTVDETGCIDFPVLGKLNISGKTRSEVASYIKHELISRQMLKDPIVTVDFLDLFFSVMGEVNAPGRFLMDHDKTTLIDALSRAGDLTINGKRDNVLVMREEDGKQMAYRVDLTNIQSLFNSPVYYLKQGDMIYVEPNEKKAREATAAGNAFLQPTLWISLASLLTSVSVLIFK